MHLRAFALVFVSCLLSMFSLAVETPQLVKDLAVGVSPNGSAPRNFALAGNTVFFAATTDDLGQELWKTDGTPGGTVLVKDIRPGSASSQPSQLTVIGTTVYFTANDGVSGVELWKSDGTEAGTVRVKDIRPGASDSLPSGIVVMGSNLYFAANDGSNGSELWKSNGTEGGTVLVKDIFTGASSSFPSSLCVMNGTLYFAAGDSAAGEELWKSDGSSGGTSLVKDIRPGSFGSSPKQLVAAGTQLFFVAGDGTIGDELWKSDGTPEGTVLVRDIRGGSSSSGIAGLTALGNLVIFSATNGVSGIEPWVSDGLQANTVLLKDIDLSGSSQPGQFTRVGALVYFTAGTFSEGFELWKTDGTTDGTVLVSDLNPGVNGSDPSQLIAHGGALFFSANTPGSGRELWKTGGTAETTVKVKEFIAGGGGGFNSVSQPFFSVGATLYFAATDSTVSAIPPGELWKSDGTGEGTVLVKDINSAPLSSAPKKAVRLGNKIAFLADTPAAGEEIWTSDGTPAGTTLLKDVLPGPGDGGIQDLAVVGNTLYFTTFADEGSGAFDLWKSNGTTAGTARLKNVGGTFGGFTFSIPSDFVAYKGALYFVSSDPENGRELWKSDGTAAGTKLFKDLEPGTAPSNPRELVVVGDTLYFTAETSASGRELWKSNGTPGGTSLVKEIATTANGSDPRHLTALGNVLYFTANDGLKGEELWKSNGTSGGTVMVADVRTGLGSGRPENLTALGNKIVFTAIGPANDGRELFVSDGTAAGTVQLKDINPGLPDSGATRFTRAGGLVFFAANDGATGLELWKTDGTAAGTARVKDIRPGTLGSGPTEIIGVGNRVYFAIDDGTNGEELWVSDGTADGTELVGDLTGDSRGSNPAGFCLAGSQLFFAAATDTTGRELFVLEVTLDSEPPVPAGDTKKPTLKLTTKPGKVSAPLFTVNGSAKDNGEIARVEVSVSEGAPQNATLGALENGSRSFTLGNLPLENGRNTISITAFDAAGNASKISRLTITYLNNRPQLAGQYRGLITSTGDPVNERTGFLTATVTPLGQFTGKVSIGAAVISVKGILDNDGVAHFSPKGDTVSTPARLTLSKKSGRTVTEYGGLEFFIDSAALGSSIFNNANDELLATGLSERAFFNGKTPATTVDARYLENKGKYTVILPAKSAQAGLGASEYPRGTGYANVTINAKGVVSIKGKLADGTSISASTTLAEDYTWPLFARLYKGGGAMAGSILMNDSAVASDFRGNDLTWSRPLDMKAKHYPEGWPNGILVDLLGAKYRVPTGESALPGLTDVTPPAVNALVTFAEGKLAETVDGTLNISTKNKVVNVPPDKTFSVKISPSSGLLSGAFTHTDETKPKWHGIIYRKGSNAGGYGFFLSTVPKNAPTGESGSVTLLPQ